MDHAVQAIGTTYDDLGRVQAVTSYADTAETTIVNQVFDEYDGWGNLAREWQANSAVDLQSLPTVQYVYGDGAGSNGAAKYIRPTNVVYPNGRDVQYGYGTAGAVDDIMSRLETISDTSGTLASYKYLGLGTIVKENFPQAGVKLDYDPAGNGSLSGFDRFGRIADQLWEKYHLDGSGNEVVDGTVDKYTYQYDRAGNVTNKVNALDAALSELYGYSDLDQLTAVKDSSDNVKQSWTLDSLGNWTSFNNGTATDAKTFNAANETLTTTAGVSVTPQYDAAGNSIVTAQPGDATTALTSSTTPGTAWFRPRRHDHGHVSI